MADTQDNKQIKIKVAIRVRPLIAGETGNEKLWEVTDSQTIHQNIPGSKNHHFDRVFDGTESNLQVYDDICKPIVEKVIEGYNATIFAYGQTASGKTYTMMGEHNGITKGVIHYAITEVFEMIQNMTDREFLLRCSVLEIYNEKVYDLLSKKDEDLKLMDNCYGVLNIVGLEEKIVQTSEQIWQLMYKGQTKRRTGETQKNRESSRSHFIFRMILESSVKGEEDPLVKVSQLNLVDLAGSESVSQNKSKDVRFKEGIHINLSLATLSRVIKQLSEKPDQFINYRGSRLTRLLQSSLGGNAHTAIICTVTPTSLNETLSTLNFAANAKLIKNLPQKNEILTDQALLKQYANQIKKLSEELKATKEQGELELEAKKKQNETLKKKIEKLQANFVCQAPENKVKAIRRETWGGHLDSRRFLDPRNLHGYQLPNIFEEESEGESESPDLNDCMKHRNSREVSRFSTSSLSSTCISKNIHKDIGVQTNNEFLEENADIDELLTMVSDLKSQLTTLQNEFAEHLEYTTYEKQVLKAEHELQVENEALKAENVILRRKLESKSLLEKSHLTSFNESKELENNFCKNKFLKSGNNEMHSSSVFSNSFDNSYFREKCDSNKSAKEISLSESTLLDESHEKSNFLSLYDECMENEVVSKLKSEIENLKHDVEIKNKQLILLNDKLVIKEQFITSLQDEIALNKNTDSLCADMKDEFMQIHEDCQTTLIQVSPTKSLNNDSHVKCFTDDQFTQITPRKTIEFGVQYCTNEVVNEHAVQTSPVQDLKWFSGNILKEILKVDRYSQITDSFTEAVSDTDAKERISSELFNQSSQTSPICLKNISSESSSIACNDVFIEDSFKKSEICGYASDEIKILVKKVGNLKHYTCSILKKCVKIEYLKDVDEYLSDVNDSCSKSALEKISDLENLISILGYYVSNRDEDCEIINSQLESKFQEINTLDMELSEVKQALNARESELSSLSNLFLDLKQSFSQLTFICQVLNYVDSQEKFDEIKGKASMPTLSHSRKLEYEMTVFKNHFIKLDSYIEEHSLKLISLSEELKQVKSELAAAQKEALKLSENSCVNKNTLTKSVQTLQDVSTTDTIVEDKLVLELKNEINILLKQVNHLEEKNKDLQKEIDELYVSDSERIENLERDFTNTWKIKTEMLVKDLERKYDQELIDQERKFNEELHVKVQEIRQENLKQLEESREKIEEIKLSYNKELSVIKEQYEKQIASIQSEKELLKNQLSENERKINAFKEKYINKQKEFRKINSELKVRMQHYIEEIEKLKNENTPSNQLQVIEKLKEKMYEISDERDFLQKKCISADQQISELKEHNNHLKHELKKINEVPKQNIHSKISKLEETNKELMYDLDQKKAKIMTLQSNNTSMLQELKKLKEMLSSKAPVSCKCKLNSKESNPDALEKNEEKKDKRNKMDSKNDLDGSEKTAAMKMSIDENATPRQNDYSNNKTPDQNALLCVGGGSGSANMVKSYWLEGIVHKKDKEIQKLREELGDVKSQLKNIKLQPVITEEKQPELKEIEIKKPEIMKAQISPLREVDENVTVQLKSLHPYPGGAVPKNPRKHSSREKNGGLTSCKPYDKHQHAENKIKKENIAFDRQRPVNTNVNDHEPKTKYDVVNQLANSECKQQ